ADRSVIRVVIRRAIRDRADRGGSGHEKSDDVSSLVCRVDCPGDSVRIEPADLRQSAESTAGRERRRSDAVAGEEGPIPFVNITVMPASGRSRGNAFRSVTTDEAGNFKVDGLRPIAWTV